MKTRIETNSLSRTPPEEHYESCKRVYENKDWNLDTVGGSGTSGYRCKRVYENKDWNLITIPLRGLTIPTLQESLWKQGLKLYYVFGFEYFKSELQESLRKQGLKQSETPFGVSDTFPAYKNADTFCGAK